jgi:hypothetical protein
MEDSEISGKVIPRPVSRSAVLGQCVADHRDGLVQVAGPCDKRQLVRLSKSRSRNGLRGDRVFSRPNSTPTRSRLRDNAVGSPSLRMTLQMPSYRTIPTQPGRSVG